MPEPTRQPLTAKQKAGTGAAAIALILGAVYANEGGYVNDKHDPGGETNLGITRAEARRNGFDGKMIDLRKHCTSDKDVCADKIYTQKYIFAPGFGPMVDIAPAVAEELVDTAVNMGPARPSRWFQQAVGAPVDGHVGKATIVAYVRLEQRVGKLTACIQTLNALDARQLAEYQRLVRVNPSLQRYYKGWTHNRIGNVDRKRCRL